MPLIFIIGRVPFENDDDILSSLSSSSTSSSSNEPSSQPWWITLNIGKHGDCQFNDMNRFARQLHRIIHLFDDIAFNGVFCGPDPELQAFGILAAGIIAINNDIALRPPVGIPVLVDTSLRLTRSTACTITLSNTIKITCDPTYVPTFSYKRQQREEKRLWRVNNKHRRSNVNTTHGDNNPLDYKHGEQNIRWRARQVFDVFTQAYDRRNENAVVCARQSYNLLPCVHGNIQTLATIESPNILVVVPSSLAYYILNDKNLKLAHFLDENEEIVAFAEDVTAVHCLHERKTFKLFTDRYLSSVGFDSNINRPLSEIFLPPNIQQASRVEALKLNQIMSTDQAQVDAANQQSILELIQQRTPNSGGSRDNTTKRPSSGHNSDNDSSDSGSASSYSSTGSSSSSSDDEPIHSKKYEKRRVDSGHVDKSHHRSDTRKKSHNGGELPALDKDNGRHDDRSSKKHRGGSHRKDRHDDESSSSDNERNEKHSSTDRHHRREHHHKSKSQPPLSPLHPRAKIVEPPAATPSDFVFGSGTSSLSEDVRAFEKQTKRDNKQNALEKELRAKARAERRAREDKEARRKREERHQRHREERRQRRREEEMAARVREERRERRRQEDKEKQRTHREKTGEDVTRTKHHGDDKQAHPSKSSSSSRRKHDAEHERD